ncbi:hypothetical protein [Prochlorococcus marinus]|uniref:hypothetical protein n=1 Tax=Prochlorococcus marinus TaxID=1219 RepID=UPI0022B3556B|nr:hypothetical protein [Prochlorococcus marinus]
MLKKQLSLKKNPAKIKARYSSDDRWAKAALESSINYCLKASSYPSCPVSIQSNL